MDVNQLRRERAAFLEFRRADEKYRRGDGITDDELKILITRYSSAYNALRAAWHPSYGLPTTDLHTRLRELQGFRESRKRRHG